MPRENDLCLLLQVESIRVEKNFHAKPLQLKMYLNFGICCFTFTMTGNVVPRKQLEEKNIVKMRLATKCVRKLGRVKVT